MSKKAFYIIASSITLIIFIFMAFLMCSNHTTADADSTIGFEVLAGGTWDAVHIVYDRETGVMYVRSNGSHNMGTMTLMVNPDGTPRVYEGFSKPQ